MKHVLLILALLSFFLSACGNPENPPVNDGNMVNTLDDWDIYEDTEYGIGFQYPKNWVVNELDTTDQLDPFLNVSPQDVKEPSFTIYASFNGGFECSSSEESESILLKSGETVNREVLNLSGNPECNPSGEDQGERMVLVHLPDINAFGNALIIYRFNKLEAPDALSLFDQILSTFELKTPVLTPSEAAVDHEDIVADTKTENIPMPDYLTDDLVSYTDEDHDIEFTLSYPENWYMVRNVASDNLENGVELAWSTDPIEQTSDFDDPDRLKEGYYWISFDSQDWDTSSHDKGVWFSTGSYPEGYVESLIQGLINSYQGTVSKEDVHYTYNGADINGVSVLVENIQLDKPFEEHPALTFKIYTFDYSGDSDFSTLAGFVLTNDPFRDEFLELFDKIANTLIFSKADKKIRNDERANDISQIAEAINSYKSDYGTYPIPEESSGECLAPDSSVAINLLEYLPNIPKDPVWEDDSHLCSGSYYYHYYADTAEYLLISEMEYNGSREVIDFSMFCNVDLSLIESTSSADDLELKLAENESCFKNPSENPFSIDASSR